MLLACWRRVCLANTELCIALNRPAFACTKQGRTMLSAALAECKSHAVGKLSSLGRSF